MKEQLESFLKFAASLLAAANTKSEKITVLDHIALVGKALTQFAAGERKKLTGDDKELLKAFIHNQMNKL